MFDRTELKKFTDAGREIASAANTTFEQWAEGEMGVVLKLWASNVPVTSEEKAKMRGRSRAAGKTDMQRGAITVNTGRRNGQPGLLWFRAGKRRYLLAGDIPDSGMIDYAKRHFRDADWAQIAAKAKEYASLMPGMVEAGKGAVGLARQSVVQIADSLGIALEAVRASGLAAGDISKARKARASDGKEHENGSGQRERSNGHFSIEAINHYPRIRESGVDMALQRVVENRLSFHLSNLQGPLKVATERVARAYPYLEVRS